MRSACLILLVSLTVCNLTVNLGQNIPDESDKEERVPLDDILQRAQNIIFRSLLKKIEDEDKLNDQVSSQQEWLSKRQHPGKRREEDDDYFEEQKRQHPGKREDETDDYVELQRRQHPGKRYLSYNKRQHPGRRELENELDAGDLQDLEKRQHPGKRYWDIKSPDYINNLPCDIKDPVKCNKASLLLELLDNVNKSRAEEKRQHPGRRFAFDDDLTDQE
ncbi:TRH protein, partial [Atractosteus spatula]|nr:TRH protein [Atractosteus spatula]